MIRVLAEARARLDWLDVPNAEQTPLMSAAAAGHADAVGALLDAGADPRGKFWGMTAASMAEQNGHRELAQRLRSAEERAEA